MRLPLIAVQLVRRCPKQLFAVEQDAPALDA